MKKCTILLSIGLSLASFKQAPAAKQPQPDTKRALCHKWELTHMEAQGKQLALPSGTGASFMTLKPDGTFVEISEGQSSPGTWSYAPQSKTITTVDKAGTEVHKILKFNANQLILRNQYEGLLMNMVFKRVD
ncbi:lipocalin family protein [Hymenobacter armeniacus]|uniref:Lipocalin family protein n=1 Tax=Hymenobacter armeniacus TaxID=2771358 RepID=A0ABR8JX80_9BACT|nr:lipocalin family protein [Hymenobacter armeniacus]MBD2722534.1 lipocalin family protein [Hymenobacter armeniacus]